MNGGRMRSPDAVDDFSTPEIKIVAVWFSRIDTLNGSVQRSNRRPDVNCNCIRIIIPVIWNVFEIFIMKISIAATIDRSAVSRRVAGNAQVYH